MFFVKYSALPRSPKDKARRTATYARKLLLPFPDQNRLYYIAKWNAIAVERKVI